MKIVDTVGDKSNFRFLSPLISMKIKWQMIVAQKLTFDWTANATIQASKIKPSIYNVLLMHVELNYNKV